MKYWKRWLLPPPLTVGPVYRMSDTGEFQTWRSDEWTTIDAFDPQADTMLDEIDETEAVALTSEV